MNEPNMGQYGGVVTRALKLFRKNREPGELLTAEELGTIPFRHRRALRNAGLVEYYGKDEGVAKGLVATSSTPTPSKRNTVKKKTSAKKKVARKKSSKQKQS